MLASDISCFAESESAMDVFRPLASGQVPLGFCRTQPLEDVGPAIMIVGPFFKKGLRLD